MTVEKDEPTVVVRGGVIVNPIPQVDRMAGLGTLNKLPIGPTLSMFTPDIAPIAQSVEPSKEEPTLIKKTS